MNTSLGPSIWKSRGELDQPEAEHGCPVAFTCTPEDAPELLKDFEILDLHQPYPSIVEKYVRYEYERLPWFKAMPAEVFHDIERASGWHLPIRCRLRRARSKRQAAPVF